ncbi:MAG TPA: glycosyltransferase family 2 protein [Candidatus Paceibacterota bacterium]|nr:glycosyltransferase family 2 protein [Candidatus Paceibacterota bacterium]
MEISFIIANYNGKETIEKCIESILKQNYPKNKYEIIVTDNVSPDESWKLVQKYKKVKLIRNKKNYGFIKSNNLAVKSSSGKFLVFMNNDVELIEKNWLRILIGRLKKDEMLGGICCKIIYPSGKIWYGGGKVYFPGFAKHLKLEKEGYVDYLGLAAGIIRRETGEIYFDEKLGMYGEDTELCKRIRKKGYKLLYYPYVTAHHYIKEKKISENEEYGIQKNRGYYYTKFYGLIGKILYLIGDILFFFPLFTIYRIIKYPRRIKFWKKILKARIDSIKLMLD